MLEAGQVVEVEVRTVAGFGLLCLHGDQDVRVLIPETSWVASYCSCVQFASPGDRFTVKVLHVDAPSGKVSASIRALYPNPWSTGALAVGTTHNARVVRPVEHADRCGDAPGWLLELVPGAFVVLCHGGTRLEDAASCVVMVQAADPSSRSVQVALAE
jgi:predicted RNA-binding protein with RPS1 domain